MINAPTDLGKELRDAAFKGKSQVVKKLVESHKDLVNKEGQSSGKTALHFAAQKGHYEIVEYLIGQNALIDKTDADLNTALMLAIINKQFKVAKYLLEKNCKVDIVNKFGMNALQLAMLHKEQEIEQLIRTKLAQNPSLHITKTGDIQVVNSENIHQSLIARFGEIKPGNLPGKHNILSLPILIISITDNKDNSYDFFQKQLPLLKRLGYKIILREYNKENAFIDEQALNDNFVQENFSVQAIGFSENQRTQTLYQQKSTKFIGKQLSEYAKQSQGGVILLLNSGAVNANEVVRKLPLELSNQCLQYSSCSFDPVQSLTEQLSQLTLSSIPLKDPQTDFWKPIEQFITNQKPSRSYDSSNALGAMRARLKRIVEEFETVVDSDKSVCGLLAFTENNPFDINKYNQLVTKIERKVGITPVLKWSSLMVPDLSKASPKPQVFPYFPQGKQSDFEFKNTLNYWIQLEQDNTPQSTENPSIERYYLKFPPGEEVILENGVVVKIELIKAQKTLDIGADFISRTQLLSAFLKVYFRNKPMLLCRMNFSNKVSGLGALNTLALQETVEMLVVRGAIVDQTLADQEIRRTYNWVSKKYTNYYSNFVQSFYNLAYAYIARLILNKLPANQEEISLFSFGCGPGDELFTVTKQLRAKNYQVSTVIGFDINQNNYADRINNSEGIKFVQGDILHLSGLLNKAKYNKDSFKIGLFLGILVAGCMKGTYQALKVLQQARNFNTIIIGGATVVLVNKTTLEAAGFEVAVHQTNEKLEPLKAMKEITPEAKIVDAHPFYYLTPMSAKKREQYLIKRGTNRSSLKIFNCLDLSFSAEPLRDLLLFSLSSLHAIKQIDLSWSYLLDTEIEPFFAQLSQLEIKDPIILISKHQPGYNKIVQTLKNYPKMILIERLDNKNADEIPPFCPTEAKSLGIYQELPRRKITCK